MDWIDLAEELKGYGRNEIQFEIFSQYFLEELRKSMKNLVTIAAARW
jgi:hypothetical protein